MAEQLLPGDEVLQEVLVLAGLPHHVVQAHPQIVVADPAEHLGDVVSAAVKDHPVDRHWKAELAGGIHDSDDVSEGIPTHDLLVGAGGERLDAQGDVRQPHIPETLQPTEQSPAVAG
jgi:hypothetical protein